MRDGKPREMFRSCETLEVRGASSLIGQSRQSLNLSGAIVRRQPSQITTTSNFHMTRQCQRSDLHRLSTLLDNVPSAFTRKYRLGASLCTIHSPIYLHQRDRLPFMDICFLDLFSIQCILKIPIADHLICPFTLVSGTHEVPRMILVKVNHIPA